MAHTEKFQNIMNSTSPLISGVKKFDHLISILEDIRWLPIDKCIQFQLLCMTFRALNGLALQYLSDLPIPYSPSRALRSAEQQLLCIPKAHTKNYGARAFAYVAPLHYNALPLNIRQSTSIDMFKIQLKTYFFRQSYAE